MYERTMRWVRRSRKGQQRSAYFTSQRLVDSSSAFSDIESRNNVHVDMAATRTFRFLTATQVARIHLRYIAKALPSQPEMLESAVASPINAKLYGASSDVFRLAGILSVKVIKNHAFPDGDKRTALRAVDIFLKINGHQLKEHSWSSAMSESDIVKKLESAHRAVAEDNMGEEELGDVYEESSAPMDKELDVETAEYQKEAEEH
ncbi:uncharacterized protein BKA78DRAFT_297975 [Phyllosticta capitalensis]|uniref:uncharacterized protein n=1 Tax=Phyllosticta capitalensis TaxID=121624 RepID=UPI00312D8167